MKNSMNIQPHPSYLLQKEAVILLKTASFAFLFSYSLYLQNLKFHAPVRCTTFVGTVIGNRLR